MHLPSTPVLILLLAPFALWAMLFILAECGSVTLKPLVPWLLAACWIFWGAGTIANISNRRWKDALYFIYFLVFRKVWPAQTRRAAAPGWRCAPIR
jgi:hypothetical protein